MELKKRYSLAKAVLFSATYYFVILAVTSTAAFCEVFNVPIDNFGLCISSSIFVGRLLILLGLLLLVRKLYPFKKVNLSVNWRFVLLSISAGIFIIYIQKPLRYVFEIISGIESFDFSPSGIIKFEKWDVFIFASNVLAVPILEELVFRHIIFSRLLERFSSSIAIIFSSILFGLVHLPNVSQTIFAFIGGVIACLILRKTKLLLYPIVFHIFWNGLIYLSHYTPIYLLSTTQ